MAEIKGTPRRALGAATAGFFAGFAAVALFGPTASRFQAVMHLGPLAVSLLVAAPALSGALLRIPFAAWVDTAGGRKPFLVLLVLSLAGMAGVLGVIGAYYPDHMSPELYPVLVLLGLLCGCGIATFSVGVGQLSYWYPPEQQGRALAIYAGIGNLAPGLFSVLLPVALVAFSLAGAYLAWLILLAAGTVVYALYAANSWYFQYRAQGMDVAAAVARARAQGQELFPTGGLKQSLLVSAHVWRTWALVWLYFTTFGGFVALTAWLPTYWHADYGVGLVAAGGLTALFSLLASGIRMLGGVMSDRLREGGENTAVLALLIMLVGAVIMTDSTAFELAVPGELLLAIGMGICNAAVFKMVPQAVPEAVGGAAGWVGGLGALGGFVIPPIMGFAVHNLGHRGYAIGFVVFVYLALFALIVAWVLKYTGPATVAPHENVREADHETV